MFLTQNFIILMTLKQIILFPLIAIFILGCNVVQVKSLDLDVWADICGGNFDEKVEIKLHSNNPQAKIFWTIYSDGSPAEGFMYENSITIEESTSLYFFAFTDYDNATLYQVCNYKINKNKQNYFINNIFRSVKKPLKALYYPFLIR